MIHYLQIFFGTDGEQYEFENVPGSIISNVMDQLEPYRMKEVEEEEK
jgi:hypothetical protein